MRRRLKLPLAIAAAVLVTWSASAAAYDQQISSRLWAEGYSVFAPDGKVVSRRRFVEDLRLGAWNMLPGSDDPYYRGPRLSIEIDLRLNADFAVAKNESRASSELHYVPGLTPLDVEAVIAYLDARGLLGGVLDVRAGRQIRVDTLGFFAFDGFETRFLLPIGLTLDTFFGYEVLGGQLLGYDALELDGTDKGGRHGMETDRYPDRENPESRLAVGTELAIHPVRWIEAAASFRVVGLSGPLADERLGGRLTLGGDPVRADGRVVWSPLVDKVTEADGSLAAQAHRAVVIAVDYHLYHPLFEGDSIFNVFNLTDQNDLGGRVELRLTERLNTAVWGFARLAAESAGLDGTEESSAVAGAGGGVGGNYRTKTREMSARVTFDQEWGERRVGGEIGGGMAVLPGERLWLRVRCSAWHIDDAFSELFSGNIAGYIMSARFRLTDGAHLLGEFEHYLGGGRDQRFIALALLQLDLWR